MTSNGKRARDRPADGGQGRMYGGGSARCGARPLWRMVYGQAAGSVGGGGDQSRIYART